MKMGLGHSILERHENVSFNISYLCILFSSRETEYTREALGFVPGAHFRGISLPVLTNVSQILSAKTTWTLCLFFSFLREAESHHVTRIRVWNETRARKVLRRCFASILFHAWVWKLRNKPNSLWSSRIWSSFTRMTRSFLMLIILLRR